MVEVKNLTKKYGSRTAIDNLNFTINAGEIVGFLGPNGAGKTTTMNIMSGFIAASAGDVKINGIDIVDEPERAKSNIGYLPDTPPLYGEMRVIEYLNFVADIKGVRKNRKQMLENIMEQVNILSESRRLIRTLSRGYRQRVGLAQAMIGEPKVIIMDEPTTGLDPKQIIEMRDVIKNLGKKHTVILSSHIMQEVNAVCERVLIINNGKIAAQGTTENLSQGLHSGGQTLIRTKGNATQIEQALRLIPQLSNITQEPQKEHGTIEFLVTADSDIREEIFLCMAKNNFPILQMKPKEFSLEEVFLSVTK